MNHMLPGKLNEFVLIQRGPDGSYAVEYGPRDPEAGRYTCSDFKSVAEAIEWVDRLDQSIFGFAPSAGARAAPITGAAATQLQDAVLDAQR
jgi:hypothetical protein